MKARKHQMALGMIGSEDEPFSTSMAPSMNQLTPGINWNTC